MGNVGAIAGIVIDNARLVANPVCRAASRSPKLSGGVRCRSSRWGISTSSSGVPQWARLGTLRLRLGRIEQPRVQSLAASVAVATQVRLVRRAQGEVPGLRHDERRRVDSPRDQHQPLGCPGDDPVVRSRTGPTWRGRRAPAPRPSGPARRSPAASATATATARRCRASQAVPNRRPARSTARTPATASGRAPAPATAARCSSARPTERPGRPTPPAPPRARTPIRPARRSRGRPSGATPPSAPEWSSAARGHAASRRCRRGSRRRPRGPLRARSASPADRRVLPGESVGGWGTAEGYRVTSSAR